MNSTEDFQTPDELRPAKRARVAGSLAVTEETREEAMDEDDWDDVYGGPGGETDASSSTAVGDASFHARAQLSPNGNAVQDLAAPVAVTDGQKTPVASRGDDLVAPGPAVEGMDTQSARVLDETTEVETGEPGRAASEETLTGDAQRATNADVKMEDTQEGDSAAPMETDTPSTKPIPADDPEFTAAAAAQKGNKDAEWQFDSSDAESSSDSDSSDSDSSDDEDSDSDGGYELLDPATAAKILMSGDGDDDDGENRGKGGAPYRPRTTNEVAETVVPKPDVQVTPDMKITLLGTIERTVENMALIKGATPGEYQVLESGSVLCNEKREVVGAVAETFGRVQEPMYSVAFSSDTEIVEAGLQPGTQIYYVDSHSTFVFTQPLKNLKGTDASNIHDEEVGEDEIEFSDDEKEAEYKRQKKMAKKAGRGGLSRSAFNGADGAQSGVSGARSYDQGGNDAPSQHYGGGMSYDDNDETMEEFYQPLKRPDNLSQMMVGGAPPPRPHHPSERGRGRGRGDRGKGRGDRGRGRGGSDNHGHGQHRGGRGGAAGQQSQPSGHRGNARSFPDRHNNQPNPQPRHALPSKPDTLPGTYSSTSPQAPTQVHPPPNPVSQQQGTYQFNGYTFQFGNQSAAPGAAPHGYPTPQNFQPQQQPPQAPVGQASTGAYFSPAFFQQQQQQQQQLHQQGRGQQQLAHLQQQQAYHQHQHQYQQQPAAYGAWPPPTPQQHQQYPQQPTAAQQPQPDLAEILRRLGR